MRAETTHFTKNRCSSAALRYRLLALNRQNSADTQTTLRASPTCPFYYFFRHAATFKVSLTIIRRRSESLAYGETMCP